MSKEKVKTSWPAYLANNALSTVGGFVMNGVSGGATALAATLGDEYLMNKGYFAKHYLTNSALWGSLVYPITIKAAETFPEYAIPIYGVGLVLVSTMSYFGNDPLNYQEKIDEVVDLLSPVVSLFDEKNVISIKELNKFTSTLKNDPTEAAKLLLRDLKYISHNKMVVNITAMNLIKMAETSLSNSFIKYIGNNGDSMLILTLLAQNPNAGALALAFKGLEVSLLYMGKKIVDKGFEHLTYSLQEDLKKSIEQKAIQEVLLNKGKVPKILSIENQEATVANFKSDISNCYAIGTAKLAPLTTEKISQILAFWDVLKLAPESVVITQINSFLKKKLRTYFEEKIKKIAEESNEIEQEVNGIVFDLSRNFNNALLIDATSYLREKYISKLEKKAAIDSKTKKYNNVQSISLDLLDIIEKFTETAYFGYKLTNGSLTLEQVPIIIAWLMQTSSLLNDEGGIKINASWLGTSANRIKNVTKALAEEQTISLVRSVNDQKKIILDNYQLYNKENKIIDIKHLEFMGGQHYAICGASGLGKTTIFKDIKGCLSSPFKSEGEISLPVIEGKKVSPMLIDQNLYIPYKATLFEAITLKPIASYSLSEKNEVKSFIIKLFKEIAIDQFAAEGREDAGLITELENLEYNPDNLSGGQKKKIGIIRALYAQPKILLLDEVFVGLDKESVKLVQKLLSKYLPNTTFLVIDHQAEYNNQFNDFYDHIIELSKEGWKELNPHHLMEEHQVNAIGNNIEIMDSLYYSS